MDKKNLNLKQGKEYLVSTKAHLESQNYSVVFSQKNWSKPLLINKNKPCIRFIDKNKNVIVAMERTESQQTLAESRFG